MAVFNEPQKWGQTLGQDADVVTIPDTSGETDPSIDKIFPSVFSIPLAQGGRAIPRSVLNGLFKLVGDWIYYIQNGGIASYSNTFDYDVGAFVKHNNEFYRCIQANGASTTVKAPTETAYWTKIATLADVAGTFANQSFSNVNDTANILMAHNAMPSYTYDELTLGASGTTYTAPADGFITIVKNAMASGQFLSGSIYALDSTTQLYGTISIASISQTLKIVFPIQKGQKFSIAYDTSGITVFFRFIYAVGSESEQ